MKIIECYNCKHYVEESDTEKIDGKFYCYLCFDFCQNCGRACPLNGSNEIVSCAKCSKKDKIDE